MVLGKQTFVNSNNDLCNSVNKMGIYTSQLSDRTSSLVMKWKLDIDQILV